MWEAVGDGFSVASLEDYTEQAKGWLGDKSNLASKTLEEADWPEIYRHFKEQREAE